MAAFTMSSAHTGSGIRHHPVYEDGKFCGICALTRRISDGDNFCNQCQEFLCLSCTRKHGTSCSLGVERLIKCESMYEPDTSRFRSDFKNGLENYRCNQSGRTSESSKEVTLANDVENIEKYITSDNVTMLGNSSKDCKSVNNGGKTVNLSNTNPEFNRDHSKISTVSGVSSKEPKMVYENKERPWSVKGSVCRQRTFSARSGILTIGSASDSPSHTIPLRCTTHPELAVENYCRKHDAICCERCLVAGHLTCVIQPVEEVATGICRNTQMTEIITEFEKVKETCENIVNGYSRKLNVLDRDYADGVRSNRSPRSNALWDDTDSEQKHVLEIEKKITTGRFILTNINVSLQEIKNAVENRSDVLTFIALKRNQPLMLQSKHDVKRLSDDSGACFANDKFDDNFEGLKTSTKVKRMSDGSNTLEQLADEMKREKKVEEDFQLLLTAENAARLGSMVQILDEKKRKTRGKDFKLSQTAENTTILSSSNFPSISNEVKYDKEENDEHVVEEREHSTVYAEERVTPSGQCEIQSQQTSNSKVSLIGKWKTRSATTRKNQGKITTYGLVTDFYMSPDNGEKENNIVRVQSAPPERRITPAGKEMETTHEKDSTKEVDIGSTSPVSFENESKMGTGHENNNLAEQKCKISERGSGKARKRSPPNWESKFKPAKTERRREKDPIKQSICRRDHTEESEEEKHRKSHPLCPSGMKPPLPLLTREATFIKVRNSNRKITSARSRATEEENSIYGSTLYVRKPRSKLTLTDEQIVRLPTDKHMCEIGGVACTEDGKLAVSDFNNKTVKLFASGSNMCLSLVLDEPPHGIACVSNDTLVVIYGLPRDQLIVISAVYELQVRNRFRTGCLCKAVTSFNAHIYLLCVYNYTTEVRISDTEGVVSIRMSLDNMIPAPVDIAVNPQDGVIYVVDETRGVNCVETGRAVKRISDMNIDSFQGVVVDKSNNVFVCTTSPGGIYEISYDGRHLVSFLHVLSLPVCKLSRAAT